MWERISTGTMARSQTFLVVAMAVAPDHGFVHSRIFQL
jgi:hypothetical protein